MAVVVLPVKQNCLQTNFAVQISAFTVIGTIDMKMEDIKMQNVVIMGRAEYVALCNLIKDAATNTRNLDDSYTKSNLA